MRLRTFLILLVGFCASPVSAAPILFVQPSSKSVTVGNTFSLDVSVSSAVDLFGYDFELGFNPLVLSVNSVSEGSFLGSGGDATFFVPGTINNPAGSVSLTGNTLIGAIAGVTGSGTLATISFTAVGPGSSAVNLLNVTLLDSSLSGIATTVQNGLVTAGDTQVPGPVPEPSTFLLIASGLASTPLLRRRK
jgi:cohesin domain-containing protein/PEP-CTERM motif-containing protein